jgi:predicted dehydrogenase
MNPPPCASQTGAAAPAGWSRREFLRGGLAAGAALALGAPAILHARTAAGGGDLQLALIGCGEQGRVLLAACQRIPGLRFRAVCDIWDYNRTYAQRQLQRFGHEPAAFEDYRELLAAGLDLDAVLIATPDFVHAEQTIAALEAGLHVYCEKLMAHTVAGARAMVQAARRTGKKLQIGHQRRSNPRYLHARDRLVREARLLGRITHINGQWNRAVAADLGFPRRHEIPAATLARYGYESMHALRNWRWYRRHGGGPIADLGAHQIDVYNWMLEANPAALLAGGGADYYGRQWYDNVMAIYEFPTPAGLVRASYQVLTTTSAGGGYFEYFMGDEGALRLSENPAYTAVYREARAPDWGEWVARGWLRQTSGRPQAKPWEKPRRAAVAATGGSGGTVDVRETAALDAFELPVVLDGAIHQPHLENFFSAIRHNTPLTCPGESAFATTVTVLQVNEAVAAGRRLELHPADFVA